MFTGHAGKLVQLEQTISGFQEILGGKYDHLPEVAFYMVGDISEVRKIIILLLFGWEFTCFLKKSFQVVAKAERLAQETSS